MGETERWTVWRVVFREDCTGPWALGEPPAWAVNADPVVESVELCRAVLLEERDQTIEGLKRRPAMQSLEESIGIARANEGLAEERAEKAEAEAEVLRSQLTEARAALEQIADAEHAEKTDALNWAIWAHELAREVLSPVVPSGSPQEEGGSD